MRATTRRFALGQQAYGILLLLYPARLRHRFGAEMIDVLAEQLEDARRRDGWAGELRIWRCVAGETARAMAARHIEMAGLSVLSALTALGLMCTFFWSLGLR